MICRSNRLRLACEADIPLIKAILTEAPFSEELNLGIPWDGALEELFWVLWPGGVFALEIRDDYAAYCHISVLPAFRGRAAIEAANELIAWLFQNTPCPRIAGWTRDDLRAAQLWNRHLGFTPRMRRKGRTLFMLKRDEWQRKAGVQSASSTT